MPKVLITGAAGFIGYHVANYLSLRADHHVVCVDNFSRGENDQYYQSMSQRPNIETYDLNLNDQHCVSELPTDIDYVYHLAALNGTQNFYENPVEVIKSCTLPTVLLAEHFGRKGQLKRFLYAGTSEAYASTVTSFGWPVPTAEDVPLSINDIFNPRWSYGGSKMHGEIVTAQFGRALGMPISIARFHNAYGPRMGDKHVIPDFLQRARNGIFELYGYEDTRSFLYIDDAVRATVLVAETDTCAGQVVNIGSDQEVTILELARRMMETIDRKEEIKLYPAPVGSVKRRSPDISKLRALTSFNDRVSLGRGLALTARFYIDGDLHFSDTWDDINPRTN